MTVQICRPCGAGGRKGECAADGDGCKGGQRGGPRRDAGRSAQAGGRHAVGGAGARGADARPHALALRGVSAKR
jgi:hypothetical protein